jgi:hypothetical protein
VNLKQTIYILALSSLGQRQIPAVFMLCSVMTLHILRQVEFESYVTLIFVFHVPFFFSLNCAWVLQGQMCNSNQMRQLKEEPTIAAQTPPVKRVEPKY